MTVNPPHGTSSFERVCLCTGKQILIGRSTIVSRTSYTVQLYEMVLHTCSENAPEICMTKRQAHQRPDHRLCSGECRWRSIAHYHKSLYPHIGLSSLENRLHVVELLLGLLLCLRRHVRVVHRTARQQISIHAKSSSHAWTYAFRPPATWLRCLSSEPVFRS
jgi:hypothetical protein